MKMITEGNLSFDFDSDIQASKYDDWVHYRCQFMSKCFDDNKAIDIIALRATQCAWLIEIKDFRLHSRRKKQLLSDEVANKVRDSLAGLVSAKFMANSAMEKEFADKVLKCDSIKIVLHIEQSKRASKISQPFNLADLKQDLRRKLKAIDAHPIISDKGNLASLPWNVT